MLRVPGLHTVLRQHDARLLHFSPRRSVLQALLYLLIGNTSGAESSKVTLPTIATVLTVWLRSAVSRLAALPTKTGASLASALGASNSSKNQIDTISTLSRAIAYAEGAALQASSRVGLNQCGGCGYQVELSVVRCMELVCCEVLRKALTEGMM